MESTARRIRPVNITPIETTLRHGAGGVVYLASPQALGDYPVRITDRLEHWAREAPSRVFLAQRDLTGGWRTLTYADAFERVGRIAQALLNRRLSARAFDPDSLGQRHRPCAPRAGGDACRYSLCADRTGLLAAGEGLRHPQADLRSTRALASSSRRKARRSSAALSQVLPSGVELVVVDLASGDDSCDAVRPTPRRCLRPALSKRRVGASGQTRSPRSCSRPDQPGIRRASSTRSGCSARTRK